MHIRRYKHTVKVSQKQHAFISNQLEESENVSVNVIGSVLVQFPDLGSAKII